jgi:hypothetical protein
MSPFDAEAVALVRHSFLSFSILTTQLLEHRDAEVFFTLMPLTAHENAGGICRFIFDGSGWDEKWPKKRFYNFVHQLTKSTALGD